MPTKQSEYTWKNLADHSFTPHVQYQGSELPTLHSRFDGLSRVGLEPAVRRVWFQRDGMTGTLCACECPVYMRESAVLHASIEPGEGFLGVLWSKLLTKPRPKKQSFYSVAVPNTDEMAHGEGLTWPHLHGASTSRRARLLLWLTGPFALAREAPERPLHEPSGPAQSTAAPLHSEDARPA